MSLYRATTKLISQIMIGKVPARAFAVNQPSDVHTDGGIRGHEFTELIDPATPSFTLPAQMAPNASTSLCEILLHQLEASPITAKVLMNCHFESDLGGVPWTNWLVVNGWFKSANTLIDSNVPAAANNHLMA